MAQRGYFFDSVGGDRQYSSSYWASLMQFLRAEGVVSAWQAELAVTENSPQGMSVRVGIGAALVQGRAFEVYTAAEAVTITTANPSNPRIDRIVLRVDYTGRTLTLLAKAGTAAASPSAPALTRDANTYEVSLARVAVAAGATVITNANITDERSDPAVCGFSTHHDLEEHREAATLDHPAGSVGSTHLASGAVTASAIAGGAVGSTAIASGAVTNVKLAADAVTADKIASGAVGSTEIAGDAITAAHIGAGQVGNSELAAGAVTAAKITAGTITANELAADSVGSSEIAANAVGAAELANDAVTSAKIAAGAVDSTALGASAVVAGKIATNAVTSGTIASGAVTEAKIGTAAVTSAKLGSPLAIAGLYVAADDYISAGATLTNAQDFVTCSTGASNRNFTLPPVTPGKVFHFKKRDNGTGEMRILAAGSDTVAQGGGIGTESGSYIRLTAGGDGATIIGGTGSTWWIMVNDGIIA